MNNIELICENCGKSFFVKKGKEKKHVQNNVNLI